MARKPFSVLALALLTVLSGCGGGSSPAPTPTPITKPVSGLLTASVLSAYGTRQGTGVQLHMQVKFVETAGGSTTLTKVEFLVKQNGVSGAQYENTEPRAIGAKGSLELEYVTDPTTDPYPTTVDVTGTYTDASGIVRTATATGTFVALPPG